MSDKSIATIEWEGSSSVIDDSESLTGEVVEDDRGDVTIKDGSVYHRVDRTGNGRILRTMGGLNQKDRNTVIKGVVKSVDIEDSSKFECSCGCVEYRPIHVVGGLNERKCKECGMVQRQGW